MKRISYYPSWGPHVNDPSDQESTVSFYDTMEMRAPFFSYVTRDTSDFVEPQHNCKIGVDFDGVITTYPIELSNIFNKVVKSGGRIFVITGRRATDFESISSFLKQYQIPVEEIFCFPTEYPARPDDLISKLSIGEWKGTIVNELCLDMYIDDDPIFIEKVKEINPNLMILSVVGKKGIIDKTNKITDVFNAVHIELKPDTSDITSIEKECEIEADVIEALDEMASKSAYEIKPTDDELISLIRSSALKNNLNLVDTSYFKIIKRVVSNSNFLKYI